MKEINMIILLMILLCIIASVVASPVNYKKNGRGRRIQWEALPEKAQKLLKEISVCSPPELLKYRKNYRVIYHNGELWFDSRGELIKAKYLFTLLPEGICSQLPGKIKRSVSDSYPATYISGFEKTQEGYTLFVFGQKDGELFFDLTGNLRNPGEKVNKGHTYVPSEIADNG